MCIRVLFKVEEALPSPHTLPGVSFAPSRFPCPGLPPSPSFKGKQEYPEKQVLLKFKTVLEVPQLNPEDSPVGKVTASLGTDRRGQDQTAFPSAEVHQPRVTASTGPAGPWLCLLQAQSWQPHSHQGMGGWGQGPVLGHGWPRHRGPRVGELTEPDVEVTRGRQRPVDTVLPQTLRSL